MQLCRKQAEQRKVTSIDQLHNQVDERFSEENSKIQNCQESIQSNTQLINGHKMSQKKEEEIRDFQQESLHF